MTAHQTFQLPKPTAHGVTILPLGGCGQFGANVTLYGYDGQWLMVDCGMGFADERLPGVEIVLPDVSTIAAQADKLQGLVITHAHEDHLGSVGWHWPQLKCPIYASPFTAGLLEKKFEEHVFPHGQPKVTVVDSAAPFQCGYFRVTMVTVAHSVPQTRMLYIETPLGGIVHTGDWNLDRQSTLERTNETQLQAIGEAGVLAYVGDSTNAQVHSKKLNEVAVERGLHDVFVDCPRKIIVTMFASNIARLVSVHRVSRAVGRKVVLLGRSLHTMVDIGRRTGLVPDDMVFLDERDAERLKDTEIVFVVTGSQGEGRAALSRVARNAHPALRIKGGDTVLFSSRAIPGNETAINEIKNLLLMNGARLITDRDAPIHVSGHPAQDEITELLSWLRPKVVVPVHGERVQLEAHSELARGLGYTCPHIPENGSLMVVDEHGSLSVERHVPIRMQALELGRVQPADALTILERRKMSFNGAIFLSVVLDEQDGAVLDIRASAPGVLDPVRPEDDRVLTDMEDYAEELIEKMPKADRLNEDKLVEHIRGKARRFVSDIFGVKPLTQVLVSYV